MYNHLCMLFDLDVLSFVLVVWCWCIIICAVYLMYYHLCRNIWCKCIICVEIFDVNVLSFVLVTWSPPILAHLPLQVLLDGVTPCPDIFHFYQNNRLRWSIAQCKCWKTGLKVVNFYKLFLHQFSTKIYQTLRDGVETSKKSKK